DRCGGGGAEDVVQVGHGVGPGAEELVERHRFAQPHGAGVAAGAEPVSVAARGDAAHRLTAADRVPAESVPVGDEPVNGADARHNEPAVEDADPAVDAERAQVTRSGEQADDAAFAGHRDVVDLSVGGTAKADGELAGTGQQVAAARRRRGGGPDLGGAVQDRDVAVDDRPAATDGNGVDAGAGNDVAADVRPVLVGHGNDRAQAVEARAGELAAAA